MNQQQLVVITDEDGLCRKWKHVLQEVQKHRTSENQGHKLNTYPNSSHEELNHASTASFSSSSSAFWFYFYFYFILWFLSIFGFLTKAVLKRFVNDLYELKTTNKQQFLHIQSNMRFFNDKCLNCIETEEHEIEINLSYQYTWKTEYSSFKTWKYNLEN